MARRAKEFSVIEGGDFANRELVVVADMIFEHRGDTAHPVEEQIPKPEISVKTAFRPRDDHQTGGD
jgi:hypothetical protein